MAVHMYLLVNKILLLNVSAVQRLLEIFLSIFVIKGALYMRNLSKHLKLLAVKL